MGIGLGAVGALAHLGSSAWGHQINASALVWGLYFLVIEVIVLGILGLVVAGVVISARFLVTEEASRKIRAVVTGVSALMSSGILTYAFCSLFPPLMNPGAIATVTGVLAGSAFAIVSYRHTSQA
ncbi:hypothetical protein [Arthrobacter sp. FW306-2-2C-D06B]|uniref:hypothetical protein n=1 Tax=Arthrobacter sp. FW306-2-2C-D06B TaxID=2879618 RepID=UPI001F17FBB6|nr:hypothetical protein [Arthrobacter sp. FW306-2-2C-D06B]UKA59394.1 hypothetical protein LFT47_03315 [Arthrobacter sp. FW306-2-2C-D06B]